MAEETHSTQGIIPIRHFPAPLAQVGSLPSLIVNAGETAAEKFIEFFTARIRNRNKREAYAPGRGTAYGLVRGPGPFPPGDPAGPRRSVH